MQILDEYQRQAGCDSIWMRRLRPFLRSRLSQHSGATFTGKTLGTGIKNVTGEILGYIGVIRDITSRTLAEAGIISLKSNLE